MTGGFVGFVGTRRARTRKPHLLLLSSSSSLILGDTPLPGTSETYETGRAFAAPAPSGHGLRGPRCDRRVAHDPRLHEPGSAVSPVPRRAPRGAVEGVGDAGNRGRCVSDRLADAENARDGVGLWGAAKGPIRNRTSYGARSGVHPSRHLGGQENTALAGAGTPATSVRGRGVEAVYNPRTKRVGGANVAPSAADRGPVGGASRADVVAIGGGS